MLKDYLMAHPGYDFIAPDFPETPKEAFDALTKFYTDLSKRHDQICLVGSSMGGFYSTLLQCKFGFRIALINPCIHPQEHFMDYIGPQFNPVTETHFELKPEMIEYLKELDGQAKGYDPKKTLVLLQSGDEVLDYKKSLDFYKDSEIDLTEGGCHAFEHFELKIPKILEFFRKKA